MSSPPTDPQSPPLTHPETQGQSLSEVLRIALESGYTTASHAGGAAWPLPEYAHHLDAHLLRQKVFVSESPDTLYASLMDEEGNVSHDLPLVACTR
jgi:hypothetical protein